MFDLTFCFLFLKNKNIENTFSEENIFLDFFKITFLIVVFLFYPK